MALVSRPHAHAVPHGPLREVLPGVHFVTGTIALPGPLPVRFSRNMTVLVEGPRVVLVNAVRLDDAGLAAIDALGKVTDILRIAGNHGMDDPFYRERYGAKVWAVAGQRYTSGFDASAPDVYLEPDVVMGPSTALPVEGARLFIMASKPPEALLVLDRHGGTVVSGDCLQNWATTDRYFSLLGKVMLPLLGFIKPHNVGPAWLKQCKPPKDTLRNVLDLPFVNVLPAHGVEVLGEAHHRYRPAIERVT